jgi:hypothetical protein
MKIGTRVSTKYGPGSVSGFERIVSVKSPIEYPNEYATGDRIAVRLDNPENWILSNSQSDPYFYASEISPIL